jgi:hypothetical protein
MQKISKRITEKQKEEIINDNTKKEEKFIKCLTSIIKCTPKVVDDDKKDIRDRAIEELVMFKQLFRDYILQQDDNVDDPNDELVEFYKALCPLVIYVYDIIWTLEA